VAKSTSSEALRRLLAEGGERAQAVQERFDRTMLWRFKTGERTPSLSTAIELAKVSRGAVSVEGWRRPPRR
jgi:hypothetical protein